MVFFLSTAPLGIPVFGFGHVWKNNQNEEDKDNAKAMLALKSARTALWEIFTVLKCVVQLER
jgi:hypothetical protein